MSGFFKKLLGKKKRSDSSSDADSERVADSQSSEGLWAFRKAFRKAIRKSSKQHFASPSRNRRDAGLMLFDKFPHYAIGAAWQMKRRNE